MNSDPVSQTLAPPPPPPPSSSCTPPPPSSSSSSSSSSSAFLAESLQFYQQQFGGHFPGFGSSSAGFLAPEFASPSYDEHFDASRQYQMLATVPGGVSPGSWQQAAQENGYHQGLSLNNRKSISHPGGHHHQHGEQLRKTRGRGRKAKEPKTRVFASNHRLAPRALTNGRRARRSNSKPSIHASPNNERVIQSTSGPRMRKTNAHAFPEDDDDDEEDDDFAEGEEDDDDDLSYDNHALLSDMLAPARACQQNHEQDLHSNGKRNYHSDQQNYPPDPAHYYYPGANLSTSSLVPVGPHPHDHPQQQHNRVPKDAESSSSSQPHHHRHSPAQFHQQQPRPQCSTVSPPSAARAPQLGEPQPLGGRSPSQTLLLESSGQCNNNRSAKASTTMVEKMCFGCRQSLRSSPEIVSVSGYHNWHLECLRCSQCDVSLSSANTCHIYNGSIYCKADYNRLTTCFKCQRFIATSDWVRRAGSLVYHLACFVCDICQRQLSTGENFSLDRLATDEVRLLCKLHFSVKVDDESLSDLPDGPSEMDNTSHEHSQAGRMNNAGAGANSNPGANSMSSERLGDPLSVRSNGSASGLSVCSASAAGGTGAVGSSSSSSKTKRVRTTFTEEQLSILQANFQLDSNPDGQDLERIATLTGLSKRVTQVWFQNSRARQKKYMNKSQRHAAANGLLGPGGAAPRSGTPPQLSLLGAANAGSMMAGPPHEMSANCLARSMNAMLWSPTSSSSASNGSSIACTDGTAASSLLEMSMDQHSSMSSSAMAGDMSELTKRE